MAELMNNVRTVNSVIRTMLMVAVAGGVGYGGWFGYNNYVKPSRDAKQALADLASLQTQFEEQNLELVNTRGELVDTRREKEKLETSLKLIKVDRRMANVEVLEKGEDDDGNAFLEVRFSEIDRDGNVVGAPRDFTLAGDKLFVDCWIVSFEDNYVEQADALRSASLCVFKSIYGDVDGPTGAMSLDQDTVSTGQPPGIYNDEAKNEFEQQIWNDFWSVSNDPQKQKELGIRASYGQANYVLAEEGRTYQVQLRASGGASLKPLEK